MESTGPALEHLLAKMNVWEDKNIKPLMAVENLRELLSKKDNIVICPGVYDGLTARIALQAGFDCLYMVSSSALLHRF